MTSEQPETTETFEIAEILKLLACKLLFCHIFKLSSGIDPLLDQNTQPNDPPLGSKHVNITQTNDPPSRSKHLANSPNKRSLLEI